MRQWTSLLGRKCFFRMIASVLFTICLGASFTPMFAQQPTQRTFASAEEASHALFAAMQAQDDEAPLKILGPDGRDVLSSGDRAEDADARVGFVVKYQEMHCFVNEANGRVVLVVGAENWPFPIPLVSNHGSSMVFRYSSGQGRNRIPAHRQE